MQLHRSEAMGMRIDRYVFARGEGLVPHQHDEDHLTIVASGRIVARSGDREVERNALDTPILFRAGRTHSIEAVEDDTVVLNIFSVR